LNPREVQLSLAGQALSHIYTPPRATFHEKSGLVRQAEASDEEQTTGVRLLSDIRQTFTGRCVPFIASMDLVTELRRLEESPWNDLDLNPRKLAMRLADFGIKPHRNSAGSIRGYSVESFSDSFGRYLRQNPSEPSEMASDQLKHA